MMKLQQFTVLVSLLVAGPLHIYGQCPSGDIIEQKITSCLSNFNTLTDFSKGPIKAPQLNNYCSSPARNTEIQCVENLINACKQSNEDARRILEKAINVNAIKGSVKILCNNTQALIDKQDCIGQNEPTVSACVDKEKFNHNAKLLSLRTQASSKGVKWFEEKAYEALCDFVGETSVCQRPYGRNCGREIGDIFHALIHAATPPVCGGVMEHVNFILLFSLAFMALVKGQL